MVDTQSLPLPVARTVADARAQVAAWRAQGLRVGLVPTMGALHDGHLSLVHRSLAATDRTVVSLFVNPTQFAPHEDFAVYPRDEATDAGLLAAAGAHLLYAPEAAEMYPAGEQTRVSVPELGALLEGEFRPHFFTGVATVVTKLFCQVMPDWAIFGEKDYQQLQVIKRFVTDLSIPVTVEGGPTVREADGLAMSSRNAYLTPAERAAAPALYRTLTAVAERARGGEALAELEAWAKGELAGAGFGTIDYVTLRHAETLQPLADLSAGPARLLAAAWMGKARLIDNIAV